MRQIDNDFGDLEQLHRWLMRLASKRCRNNADAEDLVQDTFVQLLADRALFRSGDDPLPWATTLLVHKHINRGRYENRLKRQGEFAASDIFEAAEGFVGDGGSVFSDHANIPHAVKKCFGAPPTQETSLYCKQVVEAIDALPAIYRDAVTRRALGDTCEDVERETGVPAATHRVQVRRGLKRLLEATA